MNNQVIIDEINTVIDKVRRLMNSRQPVHPEQFTNEGLKLAILKQRLGEMKIDAKRTQIVAEKKKMEEAKRKELNITAAKEFVRHETVEERTKYEWLDTEHSDVKIIIDMIRSHASAIKEDK